MSKFYAGAFLVLLVSALLNCSGDQNSGSDLREVQNHEIKVTLKKSLIPSITKDLSKYLKQDITEIDPDVTPNGEDRIVTLMFLEISRDSILNKLAVQDLDRVLGIDGVSVGLHSSEDLKKVTPHKLLLEKFEAAKSFKIHVVRKTDKRIIAFDFRE